MDSEQKALLQKMATPTRLGVAIGPDFMGRPYVPYPWMLYAEKKVLAALSRPGRDFIIINVPPQSGKTTLFGMLLSAWYLGMNPFNQVIFVAYAEDYAAGWGSKTRDLLQRYGKDLFGQQVSTQSDSKADWKMSNGFGGMMSRGILGGITGNPGHLIIIDDVIKTMEDAASITAKNKHEDEYFGSITSRFQEDTTVLVTATRFAEDDLTGRLRERQEEEGYDGERFEVISIPALAEPPEDLDVEDEAYEEWRDELGRKPGEGLEGRYSQAFYEIRKKSLPPFIWNAVYQQDPSAREGGMFPPDNWQYWSAADNTAPNIVRAVRAWDLAATEGGGDWTVGSKLGVGSNGDIYLLDRVRVRLDPAEVEALVLRIARADGFGVKIIIEQEKSGAGKTVVEHYKRVLRGYMVDGAKAADSKEQRAWPYSIMQNQRRCWLPSSDQAMCKSWVEEHRKMMGDGRRPKHDDQIDTGAYATSDLLGSGGIDMFVPGLDEMPAGEGEALTDDAMLAVVSGGNRFLR